MTYPLLVFIADFANWDNSTDPAFPFSTAPLANLGALLDCAPDLVSGSAAPSMPE